VKQADSYLFPRGIPGVVDGMKLFRGADRASRHERQQIRSKMMKNQRSYNPTGFQERRFQRGVTGREGKGYLCYES